MGASWEGSPSSLHPPANRIGLAGGGSGRKKLVPAARMSHQHFKDCPQCLPWSSGGWWANPRHDGGQGEGNAVLTKQRKVHYHLKAFTKTHS